MAERQKNTVRESGPDRDRAPGIITGAWCFLVLTVFPLIYTDYYFNILETKVITFLSLSGAMFLAMLIWGISSGRLAGWWKDGAEERKANGVRGWYRAHFSVTDSFLLAFWSVCLVSTLCAHPYIDQAVSGVEGRYTGFLMMSVYTLSYFLVSRNLKFTGHYVTAFLAVGILVCLFGITDFYNMDLLKFKVYVNKDQYTIFTSTIGNINTYTVYVGIMLAMSGVLYILSEERLPRVIFYLVTFVIAGIALVMGKSDSGFLTLGAFFGFVPLAAFRRPQGLRRYLTALTLFSSGLLFIQHEETVKAGKVIHLEGLGKAVCEWGRLRTVVILLWVLTAAVTAVMYVNKGRGKAAAGQSEKSSSADEGDNAHRDPGKEAVPALYRILPTAWLVLVLAAAAAVIMALVRANTMPEEEARALFGRAANYLRFSDSWGTNRGYVWRACMEEYGALSPLHKLVGMGPDTFGIYMLLHRYKEMIRATEQIFDSAHNEYLQYLFTVGILGLAAYLGFLVSAVSGCFQNARRILRGTDRDRAPEGNGGTDPAGRAPAAKKDGLKPDSREPRRDMAWYLYAFGFMVICYACQAVVNINIPIATPIMWVFIMIAEAVIRETGGTGRSLKTGKDVPKEKRK